MKKFWNYLVLAFGFLAFLPQMALAQVELPTELGRVPESEITVHLGLFLLIFLGIICLELLIAYFYLRVKKLSKKILLVIFGVNLFSLTLFGFLVPKLINYIFPYQNMYLGRGTSFGEVFWLLFLVVLVVVLFEAVFIKIFTRKYNVRFISIFLLSLFMNFASSLIWFYLAKFVNHMVF